MEIMGSVSEDALKFIKSNRKLVITTFADSRIYPKTEKPFTIFMAGSPGAGKTEFSKTLIKELLARGDVSNIVRIDADDIRRLIPQYKGCNSAEVQSASIKGVQILFDHVQDHDQNVIVDGTFAHFETSRKDVERAINKGRGVEIMYLYQDATIAWHFTKIREAVEGRCVTKEVFIDAYFKAVNNVTRIKQIYGSKLKLNLIIKNYKNELQKTYFNIDQIDSYIKEKYTIEDLTSKL